MLLGITKKFGIDIFNNYKNIKFYTINIRSLFVIGASFLIPYFGFKQ